MPISLTPDPVVSRSTISRISGVTSGLLERDPLHPGILHRSGHHLERNRQDRGDNPADDPGHQADNCALGDINLIGGVLLTKIGGKRPTDEHPQAAAAISGVDERQRG